jgi:hypothetical protein
MSNNAGKLKISVDAGSIADGDSIAAYLVDSSGTLLTSTLIGADQALDVNIVQSVLPTGAATETTLASLLTELQSLTFAEDSAHTSGDLGILPLGVRNDAGTVLAGTDGDYIPFSMTSTGELRVSATFNATGDYAEDSAHASGDTGLFSLAVRNDNQATTVTSANTDYSQFSVNKTGAQYVKEVHAASNLQQIVTVGTTAVALPAAPLADRTEMFIQMLSGGQLYLGSATVTNSGATRGMKLGDGGYVNLSVGPGNLVYGIANAAGKEVVVWEFA